MVLIANIHTSLLKFFNLLLPALMLHSLIFFLSVFFLINLLILSGYCQPILMFALWHHVTGVTPHAFRSEPMARCVNVLPVRQMRSAGWGKIMQTAVRTVFFFLVFSVLHFVLKVKWWYTQRIVTEATAAHPRRLCLMQLTRRGRSLPLWVALWSS